MTDNSSLTPRDAIIADLLVALKACRSALDGLMGDSDLDGDDSPEMKAMQMASAAIARAEKGSG